MIDFDSDEESLLHVTPPQHRRDTNKRVQPVQRCGGELETGRYLRPCQVLQHVILASIVMLLITTVACQQPAPAFQRTQALPPHKQGQKQNGDRQRPPVSERLEAPQTVYQTPSHGPGVDLVALNLRRFELNHVHPYRYEPNNPRVVMHEDFVADGDADFARGQQIEAHIAALPELILSRLPEETTHQLIESLSADPTLMGLTRQAPDSSGPENLALNDQEDPDNSSIERLTKSCLTVQASSLPADQLNVTFHLYTRENPRNAFLMGPQMSRDEILSRTPFKIGKPLKWVTHGFHTNLDKSEWMLDTKDKILSHEDANVILTDWRRGASPALAFYPKAAANAHIVAKMIVKILRRLLADVDLSQVHLIGHSLGAHIMGFVGSAFTEEYLHHEQLQLNSGRRTQTIDDHNAPPPVRPSSPLIGRITACDPALPCFGSSSSGPNRGRRRKWPAHGHTAPPQPVPSPDDWTPALWTHLRPDSAILVEVMHSNPGVMGYSEPLGDFDFFPNGSDRQPGCTLSGADAGSAGSQETTEPETHRRRSAKARSMTMGPAGGRSMAAPRIRGRALNSTQRRNARPNELLSVKRQPGLRPPASLARASSGISRLSKTFNQFIRPIRNFLHAYTCSHHRSVEYMVESLYYELVPEEQRLNQQLVCQLVGYRCPDYHSFKRGFCFTCRNKLECRSFGLSSSSPMSLTEALETSFSNEMGYTPTLASQYAGIFGHHTDRHERSFQQDDHHTPNDAPNRSHQLKEETHERTKRILPTLTQYRQDYKPIQRNQYFFDTKPLSQGSFCLNHYHLLVKYRWFRIRDSVTVERFRLFGSLNDFVSFDQAGKPVTSFKFNKFSQHTYTMLLTSVEFLGKLEALLIYEDQLKSQLIEYIDVTYMSNMDARVRSLSSARLCRADSFGQTSDRDPDLLNWLGLQQQPDRSTRPINLFVRCPSANSLV